MFYLNNFGSNKNYINTICVRKTSNFVGINLHIDQIVSDISEIQNPLSFCLKKSVLNGNLDIVLLQEKIKKSH